LFFFYKKSTIPFYAVFVRYPVSDQLEAACLQLQNC